MLTFKSLNTDAQCVEEGTKCPEQVGKNRLGPHRAHGAGAAGVTAKLGAEMCDFQCPQNRHNVCFKNQYVCPVLLLADNHKSHFCLESLPGQDSVDDQLSCFNFFLCFCFLGLLL